MEIWYRLFRTKQKPMQNHSNFDLLTELETPEVITNKEIPQNLEVSAIFP